MTMMALRAMSNCAARFARRKQTSLKFPASFRFVRPAAWAARSGGSQSLRQMTFISN